MLYDILIIDDDFGESADSDQYSNNANTLLCRLIEDNLRVTWTTGDIDDLKRFSEKDLSTIRYVFQDLHLNGISSNDGYKPINSKILQTFKLLNEQFNEEKITCFINSKFYAEGNYSEEGKSDLEEKLSSEFGDKYSVEIVEEKNKLCHAQKSELLNNNLRIYLKALVINKTVEIEKVLDNKLQIEETLLDVITFENKYKKFREKFDLCSRQKKQTQLLQQIRNKLAHTEIASNLIEIADQGMKKEFWKIILGDETTRDDHVNFESFDYLIKYINSIDKLCDHLKEANLKS